MSEARPDLTTREGVVQYMNEATSEQDWERRIDEVKAANGGKYPSFWGPVILESGVAANVRQRW